MKKFIYGLAVGLGFIALSALASTYVFPQQGGLGAYVTPSPGVIITATNTSYFVPIYPGNNGDVLTVNTASDTKISWKTPGASGGGGNFSGTSTNPNAIFYGLSDNTHAASSSQWFSFDGNRQIVSATGTATGTAFNSLFTSRTTSDLAEGANLYHTDARVNTLIDASGTMPIIPDGGLTGVTLLQGTRLLSATSVLAVNYGGTGLTSGNSGGIPYFSGSNTLASSLTLPSGAILFGGGGGVGVSFTQTPFYWDNNNRRMGINYAGAPDSYLSVSSYYTGVYATSVTFVVSNTATQGPAFVIKDNSGSQKFIVGVNGTATSQNIAVTGLTGITVGNGATSPFTAYNSSCSDSSGNHLNYSGGVISCGTSASYGDTNVKTLLNASSTISFPFGTSSQYTRGDRTLSTFNTDVDTEAKAFINASTTVSFPFGTSSQYTRGDRTLSTFNTDVASYISGSSTVFHGGGTTSQYVRGDSSLATFNTDVASYISGSTTLPVIPAGGLTGILSLSASNLLSASATLAINKGGTGSTSYTLGQLLQASSVDGHFISTSTLSTAFGGTGAGVLTGFRLANGALADTATTMLAVNYGGLGFNPTTLGGGIYYNSSTGVSITSTIASNYLGSGGGGGKFLSDNGTWQTVYTGSASGWKLVSYDAISPIGSTGTIVSASSTFGGAFNLGLNPGSVFASSFLLTAVTSSNSGAEGLFQNISSGASAAMSLTLENNIGTDTDNYINYGIGSSGYNNASYPLDWQNAAYLESSNDAGLLNISASSYASNPHINLTVGKTYATSTISVQIEDVSVTGVALRALAGIQANGSVTSTGLFTTVAGQFTSGAIAAWNSVGQLVSDAVQAFKGMLFTSTGDLDTNYHSINYRWPTVANTYSGVTVTGTVGVTMVTATVAFLDTYTNSWFPVSSTIASTTQGQIAFITASSNTLSIVRFLTDGYIWCGQCTYLDSSSSVRTLYNSGTAFSSEGQNGTTTTPVQIPDQITGDYVLPVAEIVNYPTGGGAILKVGGHVIIQR